MYLIAKFYLYEGKGNFGRDNAEKRQIRIPNGKPATVGKYIQRAKENFKATYGHYPFVDYVTVDSDNIVSALKTNV